MTRTKIKKPRSRTYARNRVAASRRSLALVAETDSTYFLKLVVIVILGTFWLKFKTPVTWAGVPFGAFPLGLIVGLIGIKLLETNPFDRRIWYAVLVVIGIISYFVPAGIML
jgi:hypothetical protein